MPSSIMLDGSGWTPPHTSVLPKLASARLSLAGSPPPLVTSAEALLLMVNPNGWKPDVPSTTRFIVLEMVPKSPRSSGSRVAVKDFEPNPEVLPKMKSYRMPADAPPPGLPAVAETEPVAPIMNFSVNRFTSSSPRYRALIPGLTVSDHTDDTSDLRPKELKGARFATRLRALAPTTPR